MKHHTLVGLWLFRIISKTAIPEFKKKKAKTVKFNMMPKGNE